MARGSCDHVLVTQRRQRAAESTNTDDLIMLIQLAGATTGGLPISHVNNQTHFIAYTTVYSLTRCQTT